MKEGADESPPLRSFRGTGECPAARRAAVCAVEPCFFLDWLFLIDTVRNDNYSTEVIPFA